MLAGLSQALAIGFFGAIGALSRWGLMQCFATWQWQGVPLAIACINIIGCGLAGWVSVVLAGKTLLGLDFKTIISVGLLGAFTTYATFIGEGVGLLASHGKTWLAIYWLGQTVLGFLAFWSMSLLATKLVTP